MADATATNDRVALVRTRCRNCSTPPPHPLRAPRHVAPPRRVRLPARKPKGRRRRLHIELRQGGNRGGGRRSIASREALAVFRVAKRRVYGSVHFNAGLRER